MSTVVLSVLLAAGGAGAATLSVALVIDATDAPPLGARVGAAVRGVLERDPRLTLKLVEIGAIAGANPLEEADAAIGKAERAFKEMDLDPAAAAVEQGIAIYEQSLVALAARDQGIKALRDAHILLSKIRFFESKPDGAKDVLRRAFALDPKLVYRPTLFPPQMKRVVVEARLLFETLGTAKVAVTSEPAGAAVWLNGKPTGAKTPAMIEVFAGPNVFSVQLAGHLPVERSLDVGSSESKGEPMLSFKLEAADAGQTTGHAAAEAFARSVPVPVDLDAYAASLGVEALVFVHIAEPAAYRTRLVGGVFARPGRTKHRGQAVSNTIEARAERGGASAGIEGEAEALARALDESLLERQPLVAAVEPRPDGTRWQRFRRSKAFWYVVGGVAGAVLVGTAVGVGVGVSEDQRRDTARAVVLLGGR